jgi:hypothetical protein
MHVLHGKELISPQTFFSFQPLVRSIAALLAQKVIIPFSDNLQHSKESLIHSFATKALCTHDKAFVLASAFT